MGKKQIGLWNPATHPYDPADYVLEKPDPESYLNVPVDVNGVVWNVPCGLIFCSVCEGCLACSDEDCLGGGKHDWPDGWEELCTRIDD